MNYVVTVYDKDTKKKKGVGSLNSMGDWLSRWYRFADIQNRKKNGLRIKRNGIKHYATDKDYIVSSVVGKTASGDDILILPSEKSQTAKYDARKNGKFYPRPKERVSSFYMVSKPCNGKRFTRTAFVSEKK